MTSIQQIVRSFAVYQKNLASFPLDSSLRWLWEHRIPLAGITLLDGDHGTGKSLLSLSLAAHVSYGNPMPGDTRTLFSGGVVIVTPNIHATASQIQCLSHMSANLSRIEFLSFVPQSTPDSDPQSYRPFSLPEDIPLLLEAIERVDARLVIFDPFINLLSPNNRWTNARLAHLLATLNQRFIEHNVACLLIRNCPTKGGHARPSVLERSEYFLTTAVSRLLLTHDPFQPDRLLLSHARNAHGTLAPTLTFEFLPTRAGYPEPTQLTSSGTHSLRARDFLDHRLDVLHRRLLAQHLHALITEANKSLPVATLHSQCPNSSPFQVQRSLNDLLNMGQIARPSRGFYAPAPSNPTPELDEQYAREHPEEYMEQKARQLAIEWMEEIDRRDAAAAIKPPGSRIQPNPIVVRAWELLAEMRGDSNDPDPYLVEELDSSATTSLDSDPDPELNSPAATSRNLDSDPELNSPAATSLDPDPDPELNSPAAISLDPALNPELVSSAATTPNPEPSPQPYPPGTRLFSMTAEEARACLEQKVLRETYMESRRQFPPPPPYFSGNERF